MKLYQPERWKTRMTHGLKKNLNRAHFEVRRPIDSVYWRIEAEFRVFMQDTIILSRLMIADTINETI